MDYAVIETGGKQYRVREKDIIDIDDTGKKSSDRRIFDRVLLYVEEGKMRLGRPFLSNVQVQATVVGSIKSKKIPVSKFRAKSRYRRIAGYRKTVNRVQINTIKERSTHID